jgi:hypothetical protein
MAAIRIACAFALGIAAGMVATAPTWAGPDMQNQYAGPLPPKETVYGPAAGPT